MLVSGEWPGFQALSKGPCRARRSSGREFQTMVPCTAKAQRPTVDSWCRGTTISCCVADLRRCLLTTSVKGVQQSTRYCGALPCRHLHMVTPSLYVTRSATSSQCSDGVLTGNDERQPMSLCPHHKYKTSKILQSYITNSNTVNFGFRFSKFQLYNRTQNPRTVKIYQDEI